MTQAVEKRQQSEDERRLAELGYSKYRWIKPAAIIWVAICVIIFCLPFTPAAVPWRDEFDLRYVNSAPVTVGGLLLIVGVWWAVRAEHAFTGPVRTIEFDEGAGVQ